MNDLGGWNFLDSNVIKFLNDILWSNLTGTVSYIDEIKSIASIFLLLVLSVKAYKGMFGDYDVFNIIELGKPFILILIITNWGTFIHLLTFPADLIEDQFATNLQAQTLEITLGIEKRNSLVDDIILKASETASNVESEVEAEEGVGWMDDLLSSIGGAVAEMGDFASYMYLTVIAKMQMMLTNIIEWLVMIIFQVCVYGIYLLRTVFCSILGIMGPIAFAFSIFPAFKSAYVNWISKFVTTYLYGTITYISLRVALSIVHVGLESEVQYLEAVVDDPTHLAIMITQSNPQGGAFLISLILGIVAIAAVPVMGSWLLPNGSISSATQRVTGMASKLIPK